MHTVSLCLNAAFLLSIHLIINAPLLAFSIFKARAQPSVVVHTCNASTQEVEAGRSKVQGQPQLHSERVLGRLKLYLIKLNERQRKWLSGEGRLQRLRASVQITSTHRKAGMAFYAPATLAL